MASQTTEPMLSMTYSLYVKNCRIYTYFDLNDKVNMRKLTKNKQKGIGNQSTAEEHQLGQEGNGLEEQRVSSKSESLYPKDPEQLRQLCIGGLCFKSNHVS